VALLGGAAEMALARQGDDVTQFGKSHGVQDGRDGNAAGFYARGA
jgi:hypothetical protein